MRYLSLCCLVLFTASCIPSDEKNSKESITKDYTTNDSQAPDDLSAISTKDFREFKVLDSKYIDNSALWDVFKEDLKGFTEATYNELKPLVLDQDIPTIQKHINAGKVSYEQLTKFYLYRIRQFDRENALSLNSVIALNPNVIIEAQQKDRDLLNKMFKQRIFGMPILLKDNISAIGMSTTAGAVALKNNMTKDDAFIVDRLKSSGALILGKANLSEWAYFFCGDCPSGYSAIGGQTLNPYGRKTMDTGGSSSGSAVAVAANFCAAAIGSETSGSILSPASQNSTIGFKPTIGLLSRSGIIPISSTLDTAGPITKNVVDNAILLQALVGEDKTDSKSVFDPLVRYYMQSNFEKASFKNKRFGAFKSLMEDELYAKAVQVMKAQGAEVVEIEAAEIPLPGFLRLLNLDMKTDLVTYLNTYGNENLGFTSIEDIMAFNKMDSLNVMPYGQALFQGVADDFTTEEAFAEIKSILKTNGKRFFDESMTTHNLDGILSINNYHAGHAAVAEYPAITIPMGYTNEGVPKGLTFISQPFSEKQLLEWAYVYEQASKMRKAPVHYN